MGSAETIEPMPATPLLCRRRVVSAAATGPVHEASSLFKVTTRVPTHTIAWAVQLADDLASRHIAQANHI